MVPFGKLRADSQLTTNGASWIAPNMQSPWVSGDYCEKIGTLSLPSREVSEGDSLWRELAEGGRGHRGLFFMPRWCALGALRTV